LPARRHQGYKAAAEPTLSPQVGEVLGRASDVVKILAYQAWRWSSVPTIARNFPSNIAAADIDFKERLKSQFSVEMVEVGETGCASDPGRQGGVRG
jgi:hypothetical protein